MIGSTVLSLSPAFLPSGKVLQRQIKAWRTKVIVFVTDRDFPSINNISECEMGPSVMFLKVTNGLRSDCERQGHIGCRFVTRTASLNGKTALHAFRGLIGGSFLLP